MIKYLGQLDHDHDRQTYIITFPVDMSAESVTSWLSVISGALTSKWFGLFGAPSISFEVWSTSAGLTHRISVPRGQVAKTVVSQLRSRISGIRVDEDPEPPRHDWTRVIELGERDQSRTLDISSPDVLAEALCISMTPVQADEVILYQWVITTPARMHKPETDPSRDALADKRAQLDERNLAGVLRIAAKAETEIEAKALISGVRTILKAATTDANALKRRVATQWELRRRVEQAGAALTPTARLKLSDLAGLIAWSSSTTIPGMPQGRTRHLAASEAILRNGGVELGKSTLPSNERPVAVGFEEMLMHQVVTGNTGVGKSTLLTNEAQQIMEAGHGLIVIETEGDLYSSVVDVIPASRLNDVILMDVADRVRPVGFNPLDQGVPGTAIDEIIGIIEHSYGGDRSGPWTRDYLYHSLRTVLDAGLAFSDVPILLSPRNDDEAAWVYEVTRGLQDGELRGWWERQTKLQPAERTKRADSVLTRMGEFSTRPELRFILGQKDSTFSIRRVLEGSKILLVNLKGVPPATAKLLGTILMSAIISAIKTTVKDRPTFILLDEFADFINLSINMEATLAQARKHKVGFILSHQYPSQLPVSLRDAVLNNARSKVVFSMSNKEAKLLVPEFGNQVTEHDIVALQKYEAIVRLMTPTGTSYPATIKTNPPIRSSGYGNEAYRRSGEVYGRNINEVVAEIATRRQASKAPRRVKRIRDSAWSDE